MKFNALLVVAALACSISGAAEDVKLVPNANLSFEFPDLGETFFAAGSTDKKPARMSVILSENYSADKTFPLFVYIQGGNGGTGDAASFARRSVGPRDYIAVNLPLFKDKLPATQLPVPGKDVSKLITTDDGALLGRNYRVMLQKLFDSVPNIAADGSTLGGFSNGAHATGALLSAGDDFVLKHFTNFVLLEGGGRFFTKLDAANQPELKHCRIIVLLADHGNEPAKKKNIDEVVAPFKKKAEELGLAITWITMAGYGHEQPPDYIKLIAKWTRKEELPKVAPKAATEPKK